MRTLKAYQSAQGPGNTQEEVDDLQTGGLLHPNFHCPLCYFFNFPVYTLLDFLTVATQVAGHISTMVQRFALHLALGF